LELQKKALSLQPANPQFKLNLAKIYLRNGNKDLANKELNELTKLGEKFPAQAEVAALLKGG
jgi:Flp pilus assembly protein TadD